MQVKNVFSNKLFRSILPVLLVFLLIFSTTESLFFVKADSAGFSNPNSYSGSTSTGGYSITSTTNINSNIAGYRFSILHKSNGTVYKCIPANTITVLRDNYAVTGNYYVWRTKINGDNKILSHIRAKILYDDVIGYTKAGVSNNSGFSKISNVHSQTDSYCVNRDDIDNPVLPDPSSHSDDIAEAVSAWESNTPGAADKIIKAIGAKCGNNDFKNDGRYALVNGEALVVEPVWKVTLKSNVCLMTQSDIAQYWASIYGWTTAYKANTADDSGKTEKFLSRTFRERFPEWYKTIGSGAAFQNFATKYKGLTGENFPINTTNALTNVTANTVTPKNQLRHCYGMGMVFDSVIPKYTKTINIKINNRFDKSDITKLYPTSKKSDISINNNGYLVKNNSTNVISFVQYNDQPEMTINTANYTPEKYLMKRDYTRWWFANAQTKGQITWALGSATGANCTFGSSYSFSNFAKLLGIAFSDNSKNEVREVTLYPKIINNTINFQFNVQQNMTKANADALVKRISLSDSSYKVVSEMQGNGKYIVYFQCDNLKYLHSGYANLAVNLSDIVNKIKIDGNAVDCVSWYYTAEFARVNIKNYDYAYSLSNELYLKANTYGWISNTITNPAELLKNNDVTMGLWVSCSGISIDYSTVSYTLKYNIGGLANNINDVSGITDKNTLLSKMTNLDSNDINYVSAYSANSDGNICYNGSEYSETISCLKFEAPSKVLFDVKNATSMFSVNGYACSGIFVCGDNTCKMITLNDTNKELSYSDINSLLASDTGTITIYYVWTKQYNVKYKIGNVYAKNSLDEISPVPFKSSYSDLFTLNDGYSIDSEGYILYNGKYYIETISQYELNNAEYIFNSKSAYTFINENNSKTSLYKQIPSGNTFTVFSGSGNTVYESDGAIDENQINKFCKNNDDEIVVSYLWNPLPYAKAGVKSISVIELTSYEDDLNSLKENEYFISPCSSNGVEVNIDKFNLIKVILTPITNDSSFFEKHKTLNYNVTITVNYCPEDMGEYSQIYTLNLSGVFKSKDDAHCYFIGNQYLLGRITDIFSDTWVAPENGTPFCSKTGEEKVKEFINSNCEYDSNKVTDVFFALDTSANPFDYIIGGKGEVNSTPFIDAIATYSSNSLEDFKNNNAFKGKSMNRFSIDVSTDVNAPDEYYTDEYCPFDTSSARCFFLLTPSTYTIETFFNSIQKINDSVVSEYSSNLPGNMGDFTRPFAYSGQIINEVNVLKGGNLTGYFLSFFNEDLVEHLYSDSQAWLYDERYIVDNDGDDAWNVYKIYSSFAQSLIDYCKANNIDIVDNKAVIENMWVSKGTYSYSSKRELNKALVYSCLLYPCYKEFETYDVSYKNTKSGEIKVDSIPVYPIDLIAPSNEDENENNKAKNEKIALWGWYTDEETNKEVKELITDDLYSKNINDSDNKLDFTKYNSFSISSNYTIKISNKIDSEKNFHYAGSNYLCGFTTDKGYTKTGILTDLSISVIASNGIGYTQMIKDFEFSDKEVSKNSYDSSAISFGRIEKTTSGGYNYYSLPFETAQFKIDVFDSESFTVMLDIDFADNIDTTYRSTTTTCNAICNTCGEVAKDDCFNGKLCISCNKTPDSNCYYNGHEISDGDNKHVISDSEFELVSEDVIRKKAKYYCKNCELYTGTIKCKEPYHVSTVVSSEEFIERCLSVYEVNPNSSTIVNGSYYDEMKLNEYTTNFSAISNNRHLGYVNYDESTLLNNGYKRGFEVSSNNNTSEFTVPFIKGTIKVSLNSSKNVRKGTNTILSLNVENFSDINFKGDSYLLISGVLDSNDYEQSVVKELPIVLPAARMIDETNLQTTTTVVYSNLYISDSVIPKKYKFTIKHVSSDYSEDVGTFYLTVSDKSKYNLVDTTFTRNKPSGFEPDSSFNLNQIEYINSEDSENILHEDGKVSWQTYEYNGDKDVFYKVINNLSFEVNRNSIRSEIDSKSANIGAGYGVTLSFDIKPILTVNKYIETYGYNDGVYYESLEFVQSNTEVCNNNSAVIPTQNVIAYFPEFNYAKMSDEELVDYILGTDINSDVWREQNGWNSYENKIDLINDAVYASCATMVYDNEAGTYVLPYNTSTLTRAHYVPIWYPNDENYNIVVVANEIWTPVGMLSFVSTSDSIGIEGTLLDDWSYSTYTYIPGEYELAYLDKLREVYEIFKQNSLII